MWLQYKINYRTQILYQKPIDFSNEVNNFYVALEKARCWSINWVSRFKFISEKICNTILSYITLFLLFLTPPSCAFYEMSLFFLKLSLNYNDYFDYIYSLHSSVLGSCFWIYLPLSFFLVQTISILLLNIGWIFNCQFAVMIASQIKSNLW